MTVPIVVEFMSYGCDHCRVIEPMLQGVAGKATFRGLITWRSSSTWPPRTTSRARPPGGPIVLPSSNTSRTAPALNSSVKLLRCCLRSFALVTIVSALRFVSDKMDEA